MSFKNKYDAVVVGSGPNGLAAAITLAQAGLSVIIYEAKSTVGGGMRSAELTLPGFLHDVCSAIHPLGSSPFFQKLSLQKYGLEWIQPPIPLAHPFDDGSAVCLDKSLDLTSQHLGVDGADYKKMMEPLVEHWNQIASDILAPLHIPKHPLLLGRFGLKGLQSAQGLASRSFQTREAQALFAGLAAHSMMPLEWSMTAAFALVLGCLGHRVGWPIARGGSQKIADALASLFLDLGGEIVINQPIDDLSSLSNAGIVLLDITPRQFLRMANGKLPPHYQQKLEKYLYGPGIFKIDWALSDPIPWKAQACASAGTVHVGGALSEIAQSESDVWKGKISDRPFVLVAQQSLFDNIRAPQNKQTAWGYCHVPNGFTMNMTASIEAQIERFAPGFKDCILARSTRSPLELEQYNPNYIGGDINGGVQDFHQFLRRPVSWLHPYSTPLRGVYLCSSSTPPGGGVHGMCGYHAASVALKECCK